MCVKAARHSRLKVCFFCFLCPTTFFTVFSCLCWFQYAACVCEWVCLCLALCLMRCKEGGMVWRRECISLSTPCVCMCVKTFLLKLRRNQSKALYAVAAAAASYKSNKYNSVVHHSYFHTQQTYWFVKYNFTALTEYYHLWMALTHWWWNSEKDNIK